MSAYDIITMVAAGAFSGLVLWVVWQDIVEGLTARITEGDGFPRVRFIRRVVIYAGRFVSPETLWIIRYHPEKAWVHTSNGWRSQWCPWGGWT